jgi:hypothetical protein
MEVGSLNTSVIFRILRCDCSNADMAKPFADGFDPA